MRKLLILWMMTLFAGVVYSQTEEQLEMVKSIEGTYELDEHFGYSYTRVFENLNGSKEELFGRVLSFFPYVVKGTYDARKIIQQEDKENGVIVAKIAHNKVGVHANLAHVYSVSATPIWRIDLKDGRCRVIVSIKKWYLFHKDSSGIFVTNTEEEIPTTDVAPFTKLKKKKLNEMYTNAFLNTHAHTTALLEAFDEWMRNEGNGKDKVNDDW